MPTIVRQVVFALALFWMSTFGAGCGASFPSSMNTALSFIDHAAAVLNAIDVFTRAIGMDAALQRDVEDLLALARRQLETDREIAKTLEDPSAEQIAATFDDFCATYENLLRVTRELGVQAVPLGAVGATRAHTLTVPSVGALRGSIVRQ